MDKNKRYIFSTYTSHKERKLIIKIQAAWRGYFLRKIAVGSIKKYIGFIALMQYLEKAIKNNKKYLLNEIVNLLKNCSKNKNYQFRYKRIFRNNVINNNNKKDNNEKKYNNNRRYRNFINSNKNEKNNNTEKVMFKNVYNFKSVGFEPVRNSYNNIGKNDENNDKKGVIIYYVNREKEREKEKEERKKEQMEREKENEKRRLEKEQRRKEQIEREKENEKRRLEKRKIENEKKEREKKEKELKEKLERERKEKEKLERERKEKEKLERETKEKERMERERKEKEKFERERKEKEKLEKERKEKEKLERERKEKERMVRERKEKEKLEKERKEKERLERERIEREKLEKERKEKELEKELKEKKEKDIKERFEKVKIEKEKKDKEKQLTNIQNSKSNNKMIKGNNHIPINDDDIFSKPLKIVYVPKKVSTFNNLKNNNKYYYKRVSKDKRNIIEKLIKFIYSKFYQINYPILLYRLKVLRKLNMLKLKMNSLKNIFIIIQKKQLKKYLKKYREAVLNEKVKEEVLKKNMNLFKTNKEKKANDKLIQSKINENKYQDIDNIDDVIIEDNNENEDEINIIKENKNENKNEEKIILRGTRKILPKNNKLSLLGKIINTKISSEKNNNIALLNKYFKDWNKYINKYNEDSKSKIKINLHSPDMEIRGNKAKKKYIKVKFTRAITSKTSIGSIKSEAKSNSSNIQTKKMRIKNIVVNPEEYIATTLLNNNPLYNSSVNKTKKSYIKLLNIMDKIDNKSMKYKCFKYWKKMNNK